MRRFAIAFGVAFLLVTATFGLMQVARGQGPDPNVLTSEAQGENRREISAPSEGNVPEKVTIGFIDSPSSTCYQPDATRNECYLTWYYMSVDASPNYVITMTLTLNETGPVAHTQGFFQTSMLVPYGMLGKGFRVACGAPGAGGDPQLGKAYAWTLRARDTANLSSANYGTTYCPPYRP